MTTDTDRAAPFVWHGEQVDTLGGLLDALCLADREGDVAEFMAAYRAHTEHADANIGYLIGYVEPRARRLALYEAAGVRHPIFGAAS